MTISITISESLYQYCCPCLLAIAFDFAIGFY